MSKVRVSPVRVLAGLLVAGLTLLAVELGSGAAEGVSTVANPCAQRALFPGVGLDATIQRVVLAGLDRAACRLHTTREELVLSLGKGTPARRRKVEAALRAGLLQATDEAEQRGDIPGLLAPAVRRVIRTAPLERLLEGGISLGDLIG